ncbi:MAG: permease [Sedimentibacter sp.]
MLNEQFEIALGEFWHVGWVLVVIIAGISILTGFVREYIPQEKLQKKLKNQNTVMGTITGAALGILTPFCSASMVPVAMGMIEMSAPFSTVLPFLISAPLCNFVVVGIVFGTFGWKVALIYFLWTFCGAIVAGLTVGRSKVKNQVKNLAEITEAKNKSNGKGCDVKRKTVPACSIQATTTSCSDGTYSKDNDTCCTAIPTCSDEVAVTSSCCSPAPSSGGPSEKVRGAFQFALALFKQIAPYAILGAAISGIALAFIPSTIVEKYVGNGSWYAIPFAAIIGVPLYLRIEMAIPLLSTLLAKGMSMGAAVALLIGGTGASLPELAILSSMLKPKGVLAFTLTVLVLAILGGILFMFV